MPALKTKTNLPNSTKESSSLVDASEKTKKPYARQAPVNTDKQTTKKPKATKAHAKKRDAPPALDPPRGEGTSNRQVEVVIDRVMEEDEVASPLDDEEHLHDGQTAGGHPLRHTRDVAPRMQRVEANFANQNEEAEFWKGDDQESISDLIDDLLKRDNGHEVASKGGAAKGVQSGANIKHQNQIGDVAAQQRAPERNKQQHELDNITKPDGPILEQPSVSGTNLAAPSTRSPTKLAKGEEEDLIHSVVIKVIEHALSKNVDWYQMATEGFPNRKAAQPVKAKGKGKGKKAEPVDGEGESSEPRKTQGKVDGNYLCKSSCVRGARLVDHSLTCLSDSIDDLFHYVSSRFTVTQESRLPGSTTIAACALRVINESSHADHYVIPLDHLPRLEGQEGSLEHQQRCLIPPPYPPCIWAGDSPASDQRLARDESVANH